MLEGFSGRRAGWRSHRSLRTVWASVFLLLLGFFLPASPATADSTVDVGVYVDRINKLSYTSQAFEADLTVWFRWKDPALHPERTFTIKGAKIESRHDEYSGEIENTGIYWAAVDLVATVHGRLNVQHFPFDEQTLALSIEEHERDAEKLRYRLDDANMKRNLALEIPGWTVTADRAVADFHDYGINFGYVGGQTDKPFVASRLTYALSVSRSSPLAGIKLILAPVVAIAVLFLTSLLPGSQTSRFGVGATAIFALVSSHYLILTQLPETNQVTVAEKIVIFGLLQALVYFAASVASYLIHDRHSHGLPKRIDRMLAILLGLSDLLLMVYLGWSLRGA